MNTVKLILANAISYNIIVLQDVVKTHYIRSVDNRKYFWYFNTIQIFTLIDLEMCFNIRITNFTLPVFDNTKHLIIYIFFFK